MSWHEFVIGKEPVFHIGIRIRLEFNYLINFFYRICNDFLSQTKADSLVCETNFFLLSPFSLQQYTYLIFNQICLKQIQILTIFLKKLTFQHYKSTGNIIVIKKIKNFQPQYESRTENFFTIISAPIVFAPYRYFKGSPIQENKDSQTSGCFTTVKMVIYRSVPCSATCGRRVGSSQSPQCPSRACPGPCPSREIS